MMPTIAARNATAPATIPPRTALGSFSEDEDCCDEVADGAVVRVPKFGTDGLRAELDLEELFEVCVVESVVSEDDSLSEEVASHASSTVRSPLSLQVHSPWSMSVQVRRSQYGAPALPEYSQLLTSQNGERAYQFMWGSSETLVPMTCTPLRIPSLQSV
jgi:hypothetical protein